MIYPDTRVWFIRQMAFAPGIENKENREVLTDYNWQLEGLNVEKLDFKTQKKEVIFINFWATWCPPCIAEMPMLQKLYNDYGDKITFVFITTDSQEKVNSFYQKHTYNLPTYALKGKLPDVFSKNNSIPATYLIDKNGNIVISKTGAANWNSDKVRNLLDELLNE